MSLKDIGESDSMYKLGYNVVYFSKIQTDPDNIGLGQNFDGYSSRLRSSLIGFLYFDANFKVGSSLSNMARFALTSPNAL